MNKHKFVWDQILKSKYSELYAIYDSEDKTVDFYRIEYDIEDTQEKMRQRELPTPLILRLNQGL